MKVLTFRAKLARIGVSMITSVITPRLSCISFTINSKDFRAICKNNIVTSIAYEVAGEFPLYIKSLNEALEFANA